MPPEHNIVAFLWWTVPCKDTWMPIDDNDSLELVKWAYKRQPWVIGQQIAQLEQQWFIEKKLRAVLDVSACQRLWSTPWIKLRWCPGNNAYKIPFPLNHGSFMIFSPFCLISNSLSAELLKCHMKPDWDGWASVLQQCFHICIAE